MNELADRIDELQLSYEQLEDSLFNFFDSCILEEFITFLEEEYSY